MTLSDSCLSPYMHLKKFSLRAAKPVSSPTQPNQIASTVHKTFLMGCGAYKRRRAGNPKVRNLLAAEHARQSRGAVSPPPRSQAQTAPAADPQAHFLQLPAHSKGSFLRLPLTHDSEDNHLCECRVALS